MVRKKDEIPEEINQELESPKFGKPSPLTNTGYVLDINEKDKKVDLQLHESVQGTSIIEGLNLSKDVKLNDLEKGVMCEFKLNELKAKLSKQTIDYLAEQGINLTEIIQYELAGIKIIDEDA